MAKLLLVSVIYLKILGGLTLDLSWFYIISILIRDLISKKSWWLASALDGQPR